MKTKGRGITKPIEGRLICLKAGNWYIASRHFLPPSALGGITVSIYRKRAKPGEGPVAQVHNMIRRDADAFINAFNSSGPLGICGRKWATR